MGMLVTYFGWSVGTYLMVKWIKGECPNLEVSALLSAISVVLFSPFLTWLVLACGVYVYKKRNENMHYKGLM